MSVEFSNAYQEILLENLMAVIKQNFVFQTQLKITEQSGNEKSELQEQLKNLQKEFDSISSQIRDVESYKQKAEQNNSAHEEKSRIQTALNDTMKKFSGLQKTIESKDQEISELKDYIDKLESNLATSKLKKLNPNSKALDAIKETEVSSNIEPFKTLETQPESIISKLTEKTDDGSGF
jgi:flagellar biosynthesis chaperone FliJ